MKSGSSLFIHRPVIIIPASQSIGLFRAEPTASAPFRNRVCQFGRKDIITRLLTFTLIMLVNEHKRQAEPFQETDFNCPLEAVMRPTMSF